MSGNFFRQKISQDVFKNKYMQHGESGPEEVFSEIAKRISSCEATEELKDKYYNIFNDAIKNGYIIPAGRIMANARTNIDKNLIEKAYLNCYTVGIDDSMDQIYESLATHAKISKSGGGVGIDFSNLRPKGAPLSRGGGSSGPISFMKVFNTSGSVILTGGQRRAANIGLLDISHPDIEEFITAKQGDNTALDMFNISVKITDAFMDAVEDDADWDLVFDGKVYKTVKAKYLYNLLTENAFMHNEPGVFFADTVERGNNAFYDPSIRLHLCNPCGEICMPDYAVCCLSSLNLTKFVKNKFQDDVSFDFELLDKMASLAIRFLDNVLSVTEFPIKVIEDMSNDWRRIGLGITGLGDVFTYFKMKYGSVESLDLVDKIGSTIANAAYRSSAELAKEKGKFPKYDPKIIESFNIQTMLKPDVVDLIKKNGLRNIQMTTIAPTGTTSIAAGNFCSSGIEPVFSFRYKRIIKTGSMLEDTIEEMVYDNAWLEYCETMDLDPETAEKPDWFSIAPEIDPYDEVKVQGTFQKFIDHSISKTSNLPHDYTIEEYRNLFIFAYRHGLKGFTTFNPDGSMKGVLEDEETIRRNKIKNGEIRPDVIRCEIHQRKYRGKTMAILVGLVGDDIYEVFVLDGSYIHLENLQQCDDLYIRKIKLDSKNKYQLLKISDEKEEVIFDSITDSFKDFDEKLSGSISRLVSISLRYNVPVDKLVEQLSRGSDALGSFDTTVGSVLKNYIPDGTEVGYKCPSCGSDDLMYTNGCPVCKSCGYSKCG